MKGENSMIKIPPFFFIMENPNEESEKREVNE
jgi:hypothetical protein